MWSSVKQYISLILQLNCICTLYLSPPLQPGPVFFTEQCQLLQTEKESFFFLFFNPPKGKCYILSLGDYGNTIKSGQKIWGKKIYFLTCLYYLFHLSSHIYLFSSSFFLPLIPPPFYFVCFKLITWTWNAHKELQFQPLLKRMTLRSGGRGGVWGYFKRCFLMLLSHTPPSPCFPYSPHACSHPSVPQSRSGMRG